MAITDKNQDRSSEQSGQRSQSAANQEADPKNFKLEGKGRAGTHDDILVAARQLAIDEQRAVTFTNDSTGQVYTVQIDGAFAEGGPGAPAP